MIGLRQRVVEFGMRTQMITVWSRSAAVSLISCVIGCAMQESGPAVGMAAPVIEGADVDGVHFKLSDYRGKVVVLDFWGDW